MGKPDFQRPITDAVAACGGSAAELARRLTRLAIARGYRPITRAGVAQWQKCPSERVLDVERATESKVTRYDLRPDLYPRNEAAA